LRDSDIAKKIAEILSTWDKDIEKTRELISAKKRLKKGLMQQLLTGKKRFREASGQWKEYTLGELFDERIELNIGHLPLLAITGNRGVILASEIERKDSSAADKSRYKRIVPGDIGYNTMRMWQGVSAISSMEGIVSPAYTVCIPKENIDSQFIGYYFKFPPIIYLFWRYSQGLVNDTLNLKFHNFSQIRIKLPVPKEQKKIAEILFAIDIEINSLEKKIAALKKQKRGLMQKLLTGEIRVKT
jgi:type I restriction enzyme S subunit